PQSPLPSNRASQVTFGLRSTLCSPGAWTGISRGCSLSDSALGTSRSTPEREEPLLEALASLMAIRTDDALATCAARKRTPSVSRARFMMGRGPRISTHRITYLFGAQGNQPAGRHLNSLGRQPTLLYTSRRWRGILPRQGQRHVAWGASPR